MAYVTAPDGTPGEVPDEQLSAAVQAGYKPRQPSPQEVTKAQAAEQPGRAFVEGAARGATMGLSDPFLIGFGVKREGLKARKEENPVASGVGELAGAVGTAVATGGGASGLVGGGLKGAAFEGGLYGMGSMVSESALDNTPLTTERLAVGALAGGVTSGVVHSGLSLISKGASLGLSKFGGKGLKDALNDTAYRLEERALSEAQAKNVSRLERSGGSLRDVVEYAKREGIPIEFNRPTVEMAQAALAKTGAETKDLVSRLDAVKPLTRDVDRASLVSSIQQQLEKRFEGRIAAEPDVARFVADELEPLVGRTDLKWPELYQLQSDLRSRISTLSDTGIKKEVYDAGRKILRDTIFSEAEAVNTGVGGQLHRLQKDYAKGSYLVNALETRLAKNEAMGGVTGLGMMDILRGGGFGGTIGGAVLGPVGTPIGALAGAYANHAIREKGAAVAANALRSIADTKVASGISKSLANHIGQILSVAPEALGAYRYPLSVAAAQGADALMSEYLRLASGPNGQDVMSRVGLAAETPEEVDATGQRLSVLASMEAASEAQGVAMDSAVEHLFGSAPGRKSVSLGPSLSAKDFAKLNASNQEMLANPDKVFEQIPPDVRSAAPAASAQAAMTILNAARFLDSKAPKNPYEGMPQAVAPQWEPSPAELDRFNRYREAIEAPARVLKNMANGYIAPEQIEAIKAVYPAMYADLQQKIGERLMMQKKPLSYQQRLAVSMVIGPTALGMSPQQVQVLQQSQALAWGQQAGQGKSVKPPDGRQDVNEEQVQTEAQKLEER